MNLLWLGDPHSFDATLVGGKVAHLSHLASLAHSVPDGFCLPVAVLDQAHPLDLRDEIAHAFSALMACHDLPELSMAVRSSAVEEDSRSASFAGQHATFLNIVGAEVVVQAVTWCWASARSERALAYRRKAGIGVERVRLAVLVQQLVRSDVSAVVFSANPVTEKRGEVLINAIWGLGGEPRRRNGHPRHVRRAESGVVCAPPHDFRQAAHDGCGAGWRARGDRAALAPPGSLPYPGASAGARATGALIGSGDGVGSGCGVRLCERAPVPAAVPSDHHPGVTDGEHVDGAAADQP
jgi:hypothetical protein